MSDGDWYADTLKVPNQKQIQIPCGPAWNKLQLYCDTGC